MKTKKISTSLFVITMVAALSPNLTIPSFQSKAFVTFYAEKPSMKEIKIQGSTITGSAVTNVKVGDKTFPKAFAFPVYRLQNMAKMIDNKPFKINQALVGPSFAAPDEIKEWVTKNRKDLNEVEQNIYESLDFFYFMNLLNVIRASAASIPTLLSEIMAEADFTEALKDSKNKAVELEQAEMSQDAKTKLKNIADELSKLIDGRGINVGSIKGAASFLKSRVDGDKKLSASNKAKLTEFANRLLTELAKLNAEGSLKGTESLINTAENLATNLERELARKSNQRNRPINASFRNLCESAWQQIVSRNTLNAIRTLESETKGSSAASAGLKKLVARLWFGIMKPSKAVAEGLGGRVNANSIEAKALIQKGEAVSSSNFDLIVPPIFKAEK